MPVRLLMPPNSFSVKDAFGFLRISQGYKAFNEKVFEDQMIELVLQQAKMFANKQAILEDINTQHCRLAAYMEAKRKTGDTSDRPLRADFAIIAHFDSDETGMLFMIKHALHPCHSIMISKQSRHARALKVS